MREQESKDETDSFMKYATDFMFTHLFVMIWEVSEPHTRYMMTDIH